MSLQGSCLSHPLRPDVRGMLATVATREAIVAESIAAIIETRKGERVMAPDYGISDFVFSVMDAGFVPRLAYEVEQQIRRYEPLVNQVKVVAGALTDGYAFVAGLSQGRAAVSVRYTIVGSNVPLNLVYPVWKLTN